MEPSLPTSQPFLNPLAFLRGSLGDEEGESTDTIEVAPPRFPLTLQGHCCGQNSSVSETGDPLRRGSGSLVGIFPSGNVSSLNH